MIDKLLFTIDGVKGALVRCVLLALAVGVLIIGQALSLTTALVNVWHGQILIDQLGYVICFAICFIARQLIENAQSHYLEHFSAQVANTFREQLAEKLFCGGQPLAQRIGTGGFTTLLVEGVDQVEAYVRMVIPRMIRLVVVPLMLLVLIFAMDWVSGLIGVLVFPAIILQMILIGNTAKIEAGKQHKEYRLLANHFTDTVRGIDTLKFFGRSHDQAENIFQSSERFRKATMKTLRVATLSGAVLDIYSTVSIAAVALMLGFRLVDGSLMLFPALLVLVLMPDYFRPIREFASDYHATLDGKNSLHSVIKVIAGSDDAAHTPSSAPSHNLPVHDQTISETESDDKRLSHVLISPGKINVGLNDLSFTYPGAAKPSLQHINALFSAAQKVAIVGTSGSGKSTLAHLLAGLNVPSDGSFTLATADESVSLKSLAHTAWQHNVAYIPQNPHIFHASLRDNMTFYNPDATNSEISTVAQNLHLEKLIAELPQGMDTLIGEGAHTLSGGQAQSIALARAFLHPHCHVLIFDEPTAHLDIETELELKAPMLELMKGKLVFFATHRLHWLNNMDYVLLLKEGSLIAKGAPLDIAPTIKEVIHG